MAKPLDRITIKGFKSIRSLEEFELKKLNIMIGGNGAGKSNFVEIFRMLRAMVDENFSNYILERGGADDFMFNGPKETKEIEAEFTFGNNSYGFVLRPSVSEGFVIKTEKERRLGSEWRVIGSGERESKLSSARNESSVVHPPAAEGGHCVYDSVSMWVIYHFHDTSASSRIRRSEVTADYDSLRAHAENLAPFLLALQTDEPKAYNEIVESVRLVAPFFDDFLLRPERKGDRLEIKLSWKQKGSNYPMQPYHFSDGTIRFISLATALLQPYHPSTIIIDEPELGLHPYAIEILAELIKAASEHTQVVVSTQSPHLIDNFDPEDIIVVNREKGASTFRRLESKDLSEWLEEYSLGELWRKNIVTGGPVHE